ncbi:MAG: type II toxin-antitoxin system HicB family antitoxin [Clostridia bacterium]
MQQFVFPAVLFAQEDETFLVSFPDLDIFTEGSSIEEAFLFAKDYLRVYLTYALKFEIPYNEPTKFETVVSKSKDASCVLLIDAVISEKELQK